jgi:hypothetical protein
MRSPTYSRSLLSRCVGALVAALLLAGCGDNVLPTAVDPPTSELALSRLRVTSPASMALVAENPDLSAEFRFRSPLAADVGDPNEFDATLTGVLTVTICQVTAGGCSEPLATLNAAGAGPAQLRLGDDANYMVVWRPSDAVNGEPIRIAVSIGGLTLGSIDQIAGRGAIPIKFSVDRHPVIRVRSLREQGQSATAVAGALLSEFAMGDKDVAQLLFGDVTPYAPLDVGSALRDTFGSTDQRVADLFFGLDVSAADAHATLTEVFEVMLERSATVLDLAGYPLEEIAAALNCSAGRPVRERFSKTFEKKTAKQLATVLKVQCKAGSKETSEHLKLIKKPAKEVAAVQKEVYNLEKVAVASELNEVGYAPQETGGALRDVFGSTAQDVASIFFAIDLNADETYLAVSDAFGIAKADAAEVLDKAGYGLTELTKAVKFTAQEAVEFAKAAGKAAPDVALALFEAFEADAPRAAALLKSVGYKGVEVADALRSKFGVAAQDAAEVLKAVGYTTLEVAGALRDAFSLSAQAAVHVLKVAGFDVNSIASSLSTAFGVAQQNVATLLHNAGFAANTVAAVMKQVFSWDAAQVAAHFKNVLGLGQAAIEGALANAGYTAGQVRSAIEGFFGTVGGIFCGFFGC